MPYCRADLLPLIMEKKPLFSDHTLKDFCPRRKFHSKHAAGHELPIQRITNKLPTKWNCIGRQLNLVTALTDCLIDLLVFNDKSLSTL